MAIWNRKKRSEAPRSRAAQRMLTAFAALALAAVALAAVFYIANKDSMIIREPVLVSIMGDRQEYFEKTRLRYQDGTGQVSLENQGRTLLLNGAPVYRLETGDLIVTTEMLYVNYDTNVISRVNHFAQVSERDGIASIISGGKKEHQFSGGCLYDGENTYLFLEPVTVTWGEEQVKLAPLSYMTVFNKQGFYYYSVADRQAAYVSSNDALVQAKAEKGGYQFNLSNDIADMEDGRSFLLPPNPDAFDVLQ